MERKGEYEVDHTYMRLSYLSCCWNKHEDRINHENITVDYKKDRPACAFALPDNRDFFSNRDDILVCCQCCSEAATEIGELNRLIV